MKTNKQKKENHYYKYNKNITKPEKKRIVTSKTHSNKIIRSCLKTIPDSEIQYRGGCGFKSILLIENKAESFIHASRGYKRYVKKLIRIYVCS